MSIKKDIYPGSKWWKIDFHVHTPASRECDHVSDEDILKAAMLSHLDCIVITDHNSGKWIDKLKDKNNELQQQDPQPEWYRDLTIFPGVEITVGDSRSRVHLIAIFDPTSDSQKITSVLGACGITFGFGDSQDTSTSKSFIETVSIIEENDGMAIPAHIDGPNGLLYNITTLNNELKNSLENIIAAEFCNINSFDNADIQLKKKVDNLANLGGSDAHNPGEIAKHYSWIKMGSPSLTALRLAMMDHKYCVKNQEQDPNHLPDFWINNLEIRKMKYCGRITDQPFIMELNPELNAFIGGRGSGKSTLLEAIRITARRDSELSVKAPKTKKGLDDFMSTNDGVMLPETEFFMEIWRYGKQFRLHWHNAQQGNVLEEKNADSEWVACESGSLQERFPISIYSQKQIEELAINHRGLLNIIDQSSIVNRSEWNLRWENTKSLFLQLREKERELIRRISEEAVIKVKLGDLENNLKQYEAKGHGEILKKYEQRILQNNALPLDNVFDNTLQNIRNLLSYIGLPDFPVHLFDETDDTLPELRAIYEHASSGLNDVADNLEKSAQRIEQIKNELKQSVINSKWNISLYASNEAYNKLIEEYSQMGSQLNLSLYGEWTQQYRQLQQEIQNIDLIKKELINVKNLINKYYSDFSDLRAELLKRRREFINSVIGSNSYVNMEIIQFGDVNLIDDEYRRILNIEEGTFISSILDREEKKGILWNLFNWQDDEVPENELSNLVSSLKDNTFTIANKKELSITIENRLKTRFKEYTEKQPAIFDHLCAWFPEDLLRVKYLKDPTSKKFDYIENGSAGQKAAAILAFLLSYGNEPLIIDQPEDDLDNALIYDLIVNQIHENKTRRQLIIATHNPNIVVNGIAELVVALKFSGGKILVAAQGGMERDDVRESICTIMEGGKEALNKRYKRVTLKG